MNHSKTSYNFLPAFIVGTTEGIIVILALLCFLLAKGVATNLVYLYSGIAVLFTAGLLALGAYYTRKEEMRHTGEESRILKIYQALDIEDELKKAMAADTLQENKAWEKEWQEGSNATSGLTPRSYALSMFGGFACGGILILINNYFVPLPDYAGLLVPFLLLAFLGFCKYKITDQNPLNGMLIMSLSGMAAAAAAYYAGSFF
ncbi:VIT1/CCC1 transporter family protein [Niabella aquatica]